MGMEALVNFKRNWVAAAIVAAFLVALVGCGGARGPRFEISFPASVHGQPITGRVFVVVTRKDTPEPRLQMGSWTLRSPFFGADVSQLKPGQAAVINQATPRYPLKSLS